MTDREIIKALGCCTHNSKEPSCSSCPARCGAAMCIYHTMKNALDLITRQQEEIDMLQKKFNIADSTIYDIVDALNRGEDNDWARECIAEYERKMVGENNV